MTVHRLKTRPEYYEQLGHDKPFEIRRDDRRPRFEAGDLVCLEEYDGDYTVRWRAVRILKVWRGGAMPDGYCAFTFSSANERESALCIAARGDLTVSR